MKEYYFNEGKIFYRVNDFKLDRVTVVFVHGVSGSSSAWVEFEKIFGDRYNILSLDLRGHGKSFKYSKSSDYNIKNFSEDIFGLLKSVGIQKCILVSHSYGTFIVLEFFAEHRDMVSGLVLLSPGLVTVKELPARMINKVLGINKLFELFPIGKKTGVHIDYQKYLNSGDWNIKRTWADIRNTTLRAYLYSIRQVCYFDRDDLWSKIEVPALIVHGRRDTIFPVKNSFQIKEKIKNSELVIIENSDHIIVLNNAKEVSEAISGFLNKMLVHQK